jgi:hypothetical protein
MVCQFLTACRQWCKVRLMPALDSRFLKVPASSISIPESIATKYEIFSHSQIIRLTYGRAEYFDHTPF